MIADALSWCFARFGGAAALARDGSEFVILHKDQVVAPVLAESPARRHEFHDLDDFASFANRWCSPEGTDILFDGQTDTITLIAGARDRAADIVTCELQAHPRWSRWAELLGKRIDQRALHRHLVHSPPEDSEIVENASGDLLGRSHLLLAQEIGTLRVVKGSTFVGELDHRGFYRVRDTQASAEVSAKIPSSLAIRVPLYQLGEPEWDEHSQPTDERGAQYHIELMLEVNVDNATPTFLLTAPGLALVQHAARRDALALLRRRLDPGFLVGLGRAQVSVLKL